MRASRPHALRGVPRSARLAARRMPRARSGGGGYSASSVWLVPKSTHSETTHLPPPISYSQALTGAGHHCGAPRRTTEAVRGVWCGVPDLRRRGHFRWTVPRKFPGASGVSDKVARRRRYAIARLAPAVGMRPAPGMALYGASIYSLHQEKSRERQLSREGGGVNWRNGGEKCEEAIARAHLHSGDVSCACHRR